MRITDVTCFDLEPDEVRLIRLGSAARRAGQGYCLHIGGIDLYGDLGVLGIIVARASDLIEREIERVPERTDP